MRRCLIVVASLLAVPAVIAPLGSGPLAPDQARATHGKNCGIVSKGARDYRVLAQRMPCRRGKRGARLYLRKGKPLRGFRCTTDAGRYAFICGNGGKSYRATRL